MNDGRVRVLDARGRELAPTTAARAHELVAAGRATCLPGPPPAIQLPYEVDLPSPQPARAEIVPGTRLLLHVCCGPCATYPVAHLRERGFDLLGYWYNPNVQPEAEHALRAESAHRYAAQASLTLLSGPYEPERFDATLDGHTERPERCRHCYRLRLSEAARVAHERGAEALTTTLLISPYQDQAAIREIGEEAAGHYGLRFYFENLRRGWPLRARLAREYGLYQQQYCGCRFSLQERARARRRQPEPGAESRP